MVVDGKGTKPPSGAAFSLLAVKLSDLRGCFSFYLMLNTAIISIYSVNTDLLTTNPTRANVLDDYLSGPFVVGWEIIVVLEELFGSIYVYLLLLGKLFSAL
jgi:hypothetical protein